MKYLIFILLLGCNIEVDKAGQERAKCRPESYSCSASQLNIVATEYKICDDSSYTSSYCFCQAKKSICKKIGE